MSNLLAAVITTRNEVQSIGTLVGALLAGPLPPVDLVIVVDDQSTDGTWQVAQRAGAMVIRTEERMGIGPALLMGWRRALQEGAGQIVQLDAGGSHRAHDAPYLLGKLALYDVVVGSRFGNYGLYLGTPWRAAMSRAAAAACSRRTGRAISDWTSGYRAFRREALTHLVEQPYRCTMHGWQIEVLAAALGAGMVVGEQEICYYAGRSAFNMQVAREAVGAWRRL